MNISPGLPHMAVLRHIGVDTLLAALDAVVAVTAISGGIALAAGLEARRIPAAWLARTPFTDYRIPGLTLAGIVGGSATGAMICGIRSHPLHGPSSALAGATLMGWTLAEVVLLPPAARSWWEVGYFSIGAMMTTLGVARWRAARQVA